MVDWMLDWTYLLGRSVFETVGNRVQDAMSEDERSTIAPIKLSAIASKEEKEKWRNIYQEYLKEKTEIDWEWRELERKTQGLDAHKAIASIRQTQCEAELSDIQPDLQQHQDLDELYKAALSLKRSEFWFQQRQCEQHLDVMYLLQDRQVKQTLKTLEDIKKRSRSQQSFTATENLWRYGRDVLLLYGSSHYQVLVLVAPPKISEDPQIPQNLRGNLSLDLEDNVKEFLTQHYSFKLNAPVECHDNFFTQPISDWRVRELFHLLQPIPTIVLYPTLKEQLLTFQIAHWGISGDADRVEFAPHFTLKWRELLETLLETGSTQTDAVRLLRQTIVNLHRLVAAYLVDLHYLAIDAFDSYQPRLLELKSEFSLVAPQWATCVEILHQVQAKRRKIYQTWHQTQERIRITKKQQREEQQRRQIDRWCCHETLGENRYFGPVMAVAYSPDGLHLAAGIDNTIKIWDFRNKRYIWNRISTLQGHADEINTIAYSPEGNTLASGSRDHTLKIWDVATGQCFHTLEGHTKQVQKVEYNPDGKTLASGSNDGTIKIWDVETGKCIRTLESQDRAAILSLAYSRDGQILSSGNNCATIQLWNVATGQYFDSLRSPGSLWAHNSSVWSLAYSRDGHTLASASDDQTIKLWKVANGQCLVTLQGHSQAVKSVVFSRDDRTLASASFDNTVKLWDLKKMRCRRNFTGHTHAVNTVTYSPDGNTLVSGSYDGTIKLWGFPLNQE